MSKKNKKKLRRLMRSQMAQNASQTEKAITEEKLPQNTVERPSEAPKMVSSEENEVAEETKMVKKEVRRILLTVAILIVAVVAVHFLNIKSDFILKIGEWLSKALNISV